jgi:hypothetical protein
MGRPDLNELLTKLAHLPCSAISYYLRIMLTEHNIDRIIPIATRSHIPNTIIHAPSHQMRFSQDDQNYIPKHYCYDSHK